jgi:hypothetical protein
LRHEAGERLGGVRALSQLVIECYGRLGAQPHRAGERSGHFTDRRSVDRALRSALDALTRL